MHAPARTAYVGMQHRRLPTDLVANWRLADGTRLLWRPVHEQDGALLANFVAGLSRRTRFERFLGAAHTLTPTLLAQMTQVDPRHHLALVAIHLTGIAEVMIAEARFVIAADGESADFALVVADSWQGQGIGSHLLQLLIHAAAQRGLRWLRGDMREENLRMLHLTRRAGFFRYPHPDDEGMVQAVKLLLPPYPLSRFENSGFAADLPDAAP